MKKIIDTIYIIACVINVPFTLYGVYDYINGPEEGKKLLRRLHIPLSYRQVEIFGLSLVAIIIITYLIRQKLSGRI